jgi:GalNAc-alpha-(1->4)-GalNAc-alpha-(1->3)-diNAcBac-PP-undecaprenol alpha-1,4-N-acetyl-D-galactosaminyltransferase
LAIGSLGGGGAERVMKWLADSLVDAGHEVTLLTQMSKNDDRFTCDPRVEHISMGGFHRYYDSSLVSTFVNFFRWRRLLLDTCASNNIDVVLSFIDALNVACLISLQRTRWPIVVAERTDPATGPISWWRKLLRPVLYRNRATEVVFQTHAAADRFRTEWRLRQVRVIPNAVVGEFARPVTMPRGRLAVSVGRLDPLKGHDILLEAWARLGEDRRDWHLRIVGDGPQRTDYEALIARLGIGNSVQLAGFRSDIPAELREAAFAVLPSRVEGFPNALIEAMALGRPVVVSDTPPACREIITHEADGLLYDGRSPDALAAALRRMIADDGLRARLAEGALGVRERYSEAQCFGMWEQCLYKARA